MKRLLAITALLTVATLVSAQISVGANLSFSLKGYRYSEQNLQAYNNNLPSGQTFEVAPRIGFAVSDKLVLGADLGYMNNSVAYTNGHYDVLNAAWVSTSTTQTRTHVYSAGLFARYMVHDFGRLSIHAEASAAFAYGSGVERNTQYSANYSEPLVFCRNITDRQLRLQIVPVFVYSFGNRFTMDMYMNFASLAFVHNNQQVSGLYKENSRFDPPVGTETATYDFDLGVRTLGTSLLSLGFSYNF